MVMFHPFSIEQPLSPFQREKIARPRPAYLHKHDDEANYNSRSPCDTLLPILSRAASYALFHSVASVPLEQFTLQHDRAQDQDDYEANVSRHALNCSCTATSVVDIPATKGQSLAHSNVYP